MKRLKACSKNIDRLHIRKILMMTVMLLLLTGCGKSEFKIKFEFPQEYHGNYLLTYYAWDSKKGFWIETTVAVQEGKADLDALTSRPTLVYVTDASSPANNIIIYAEKGDEIVITGDNPDMLTWSVKGNKVSERWSAWRNANSNTLREGRLGTGSPGGKREKAIAEFVKANPDDILSTLLLLTEYDRRENPEGFLALWNSLSDKVRAPKIIETAGCPDLIGVEFQIDSEGKLTLSREKRSPELIVRSKGNGTDTLRFAKSGPALLYFYTNTSEGRRENVDSIRELSKQYPDSAKRIIADISLEADSIAWAGNIRNDSVTKVVRGWMPRGLADRDMIRMGVTRSPWFIVADKTGKPVYSGDDLQQALKAFRKIIK